MKKECFANQIASGMNQNLKSQEFENLFSKSVVIEKEASCKHDDCCKCDHDHACEKDCHSADCAMAEDADGQTKSAKNLIADLLKVSEVLDEIGLVKSAALSLSLVEQIVVEAKKKSDKKDEKGAKKEEKSSKKDEKSSKKDEKKSDKEEKASKKDDKKSDEKPAKAAPKFLDKKDPKKSDKKSEKDEDKKSDKKDSKKAK